MRAPQVIIICLLALNIGIELVKHGEPKSGDHNVIAVIAGTVVSAGILYWGGFFN